MTEQPSSLDPRLQRIAFIGPFGVGKSTAIRTVSDISVLGSEAEISPHVLHDDIASGKHLTTVAFEYGEIRTSDEERFALFGLPGQDRFEHMWRMLIPSTIGVVLLLNSQDSMDVCETWLSRLADYAPHGNLVIGVTRLTQVSEAALQPYRALLTQHGASGAAFAIDPRKTEEVRCAVIALVAMHAWRSRRAVTAE